MMGILMGPGKLGKGRFNVSIKFLDVTTYDEKEKKKLNVKR